MKNCTGCKHAKWQTTAAGRMHPSGDGCCTFVYRLPALPSSMRWLVKEPKPSGGYINRKRDLPDHCVYFAKD